MRSNHHRSYGKQHREASRLPIQGILTGIVFVGLAGASISAGIDSPSSLIAALPGSSCNIKGNISQNTGENIYHVPGQQHYDETRIRIEHGERWFCSEKEAREAGWRKAKH